jgi:hypothetical protein
MVIIKTIIKKFGKMGEKTGWSYVEISAAQANKIKPDYKRSYKVKGTIDEMEIQQTAMIPMGGGAFIIPLKAGLRKKIGKESGDKVVLKLEEDEKEYQLDKELILCMKDEPVAYVKFKKLPRSHQNYYSKWVESAKTPETKSRRIGVVINGILQDHTLREMLIANRELKGKR